MEDRNSYKFFEDLIYDITEDCRANDSKKIDFNKTIENLYADDDLWQSLTDAVWHNLEFEEEKKK